MLRYSFYFLSVCLLVIAPQFTTVNAVSVSGFVVDAGRNPVPNVDLDFFDAATGVKVVFPFGFNDNTNLLGFYTINLLPKVYIMTFDPPDSTHFIGERLLNVDLTSNVDVILPDVLLNTGWAIHGVVRDSAGIPIGDVDLDVDSLGGGRLYTPNDKTKLFTGAYWVVVPPGDYRIRFDPPPTGGRLRGFQIDSAAIVRDTPIVVSLLNGVLLSGMVTDLLGTGIRDVDVELRDRVTGQKVFVSNNSTDSTGLYQIAVPTGNFDLRFVPPVGSRFIAEIIDSIEIAGDGSWNQVLGAGIICSVFVHDSSGNPVVNIDLDFKQDSSGIKVFTPNDKTNSNGHVVVALPPDVYTIQLQPPLGSTYDRVLVRGVPIVSDTTFDFLMPEVQRINWTGQVTNTLGAGLPDIEIEPVFKATGTKVFVANNVTDSNGFFNVAVPIGYYDILISPPRGSRYVATAVENVTFSQDTSWQALALQSGVWFSAFVFDDVGDPVVGADLDLTSQTTGLTVYTPNDNSDAQGMALVTVMSDTYTIQIEPPRGASLSSSFVSGVNITGDTTAFFFLAGFGGNPGPTNFVLRQNYPNPFNAETSIQFLLFSGSEIALDIYNTLGQRVKTLKSGFQPAGLYIEKWNGTDHTGSAVASGVYFYQLKTETGRETNQMVLVK